MKFGWLNRWRGRPHVQEGVVTRTTIDAASVKARIESIVSRIRSDLDTLEAELDDALIEPEGGFPSTPSNGA